MTVQMRPTPLFFVLGSMLCGGASDQQTPLPALTPYPLPVKAAAAVEALAARSDVLVLGELHGTREVSEVTATLLPKLDELGYHALALEVPADQQPAVARWAEGESSRVPPFYDGVHDDGRGNAQTLALIRAAVSAPYHWKVICFDTNTTRPGDTWQSRDAGMARNLAVQWRNMAPGARVLAICGNLHARTADHAGAGGSLAGLWPSFAADVQQARPDKRVHSLNVRPLRGGYFNGGRVNTLDGGPMTEAEAQPAADWDLELRLPSATPATFLEASTGQDSVTSPLDGLPIQAVLVTGNRRVPTADILRVLRSKPGRAFSAQTLKSDLSAVFGLYQFKTVGPMDVRKTPQGRVIIRLPVQENPLPVAPAVRKAF